LRVVTDFDSTTAGAPRLRFFLLANRIFAQPAAGESYPVAFVFSTRFIKIMSKNQIQDYIDEIDDSHWDGSDGVRNRTSQKRENRKREQEARLFIRAQEISREFRFTYKAARFEEAWLLDSLYQIADHLWISDVLRKVKGGKEASVYLCKPGDAVSAGYVAAKIYRPRSLRNLKRDAEYRLGRVDLDADGTALWKEADVNAIAKRTSYGEEVRHQSWIAYEFKTMELLYAAGADVPKPYAMEKNAIVMDFIGDGSTAAPALNAVNLSVDEAQELYQRVLRNIGIMLDNNRIHGDLSAYNILYWDGEIKLIDFPQVVLPQGNPSAWKIFLRDVTRICSYFTNQGVECDAYKTAAELWTSRGFRVGKRLDPKYLDPDDPNDRKLWEKGER
jgi:RIO kinase 1